MARGKATNTKRNDRTPAKGAKKAAKPAAKKATKATAKSVAKAYKKEVKKADKKGLMKALSAKPLQAHSRTQRSESRESHEVARAVSAAAGAANKTKRAAKGISSLGTAPKPTASQKAYTKGVVARRTAAKAGVVGTTMPKPRAQRVTDTTKQKAAALQKSSIPVASQYRKSLMQEMTKEKKSF